MREVAAFLDHLGRALGARLAETQVLVFSEFERRVALYARGGTDRGGATAMLLLGGLVPGGRVYGDWPGVGDAPALRVTAHASGVFSEVAALGRGPEARPSGRRPPSIIRPG